MISGLSIALLATIVSLIYWLINLDKDRKHLSKVPGPAALPIIGNALQMSTDGHGFYKQLMEYTAKFGPMFKIMVGPKPFVFLSNPEGAEVMLNSSKNMTKAQEYDYLRPWLKDGLLTSTGNKWKSRRKMLTPTFHFRILNDFVNVFSEQAAVLIGRLEKVCDKGLEFDIFPYITLSALDIICETAMGRKVNAQLSGGDSEYVKAIYKISDIIMRRVRLPWMQPNLAFKMQKDGRDHDECLKILHDFTRSVIEERDKAINSPGGLKIDLDRDDEEFERQTRGRRLAFLDLLLSMAKESGLSHDDIQEEVDTFMFEGHDTTAAGMNWAVHLIGSHPEVQKKLQQEVDNVFGQSDRPTKMEDLRELKYLEAVIKESLRLFPPVLFFGRTLDGDQEINGKNILKGTTVAVLVGAMHRNAELFPEPEKFDPERFNKETAAKRHPYAYVPFSAGPRNCIGQKFAMHEQKVVLSSILRKFNIESTQKVEDLKPEALLILRPADGIRVKLTRRR